jgi:hypothetical protein
MRRRTTVVLTAALAGGLAAAGPVAAAPAPGNLGNGLSRVLSPSPATDGVRLTQTGRSISGTFRNRIGAGWTPVDGYGFLNAQAAVRQAKP